MDIVSNPRHFGALRSLLPDGIPQSSIIMISGSPGVGKTTLASQIMFELPEELPCLWFSTFSESQNLLLSHLKKFEFFDQAKAGHNIDLGSVFMEGNKTFAEIFEMIEKSVEQYDAKVVFIDSYKQIAQWANASKEGFRMISSLPAYFAMRGITTFLLGEYADDEIVRDDIFGLVDGIIHLKNIPEGFRRERYIEIIKMRGVDTNSGLHPARITKKGYQIFPREQRSKVQEVSRERVGTGRAELDKMLDGGLFRFSHTILRGPSGTGKTILGMHFLNEGIQQGENVLFYATEQWEEEILSTADSLGLYFTQAVENGLLTVASPAHADASYEEILVDIKKIIKEKKVNRIFIDSLSALQKEEHEERFQNFLGALQSFTKQMGVPVLSSIQSEEMTSIQSASDLSVSSVIDAIILLKYVELKGEMHRGMMVLKIRGSDHDKGIHQYQIKSNGFTIGSRFSGVEGLVTGNIQHVGPSTEMRIRDLLIELMGVIGDKVYLELEEMNFNLTRIDQYFDEIIKEKIMSPDEGEQCKISLHSILKK